MAQERRMKLLEKKSLLSKPEAELERLKNQQMRALVKTRVAQHFKTRSKESLVAIDHKLQELARLKAEVGTKERVDGFDGKISALEMANQKLSAHIENLISETERKVYGTGSTDPKANKRDKNANEFNESKQKILTTKQIVHPQVHSTPRTEKRHPTRHSPSFRDHPSVATCTVASLHEHQNAVDSRRLATPISTLGAHAKVIPKSPNIGVRSPVHKKTTGTPSVDKQKRTDTPLVKTEYQNFQHDLANNLLHTPPGKKEQNSPLLPICPTTQGLPTSRCRVSLEKSLKEVSGIQSISPKPHADKRAQKDSKEGMGHQLPKQLTPRTIKVNRMTHQEANNQLAIDLTCITNKKKQAKTKDGNLTTTTLCSGLDCDMAHETFKTRQEIKEGNKVSYQEGDFQRQHFTCSPRTKTSKDECQEVNLRQLLSNLTPRSSRTSSYNSSPLISPKNCDSQAWYERLPIPDVELVDEPLDLNNSCSSESDSSGNVSVKISPSPSPRQEYDAWTYLGDQTALMPQPLIRKSCKFVENLENLSLTDREMESTNYNK